MFLRNFLMEALPVVAGTSMVPHDRGRIAKKRKEILKNPKILAFRGWEEETEPWSFATCVRYVEWCHINKLFPLHWHNIHRHKNEANLRECHHYEFKARCIYAWHMIYGNNHIFKYEVPYFLAQMAYAEMILGKNVHWWTHPRLPIQEKTEPIEVGETSKTIEGDGIGTVPMSPKADAEFYTAGSSSESSEDEHTHEYELSELIEPTGPTIYGDSF